MEDTDKTKRKQGAVASGGMLSSIKGLAARLDKAAEKARNKGPRDWSHDHGFQRGKAAAYTRAAKLARRCLDNNQALPEAGRNPTTTP